MVEGPPNMALLRLLQISSANFPIGAFAYSAGLEAAIERGWVTDETEAADWIGGQLLEMQAQLEVPLLSRFHEAWRSGDAALLGHWVDVQIALREARELREEDLKLGRSMLRTLATLGVGAASSHNTPMTWLGAYALGAYHWGIPLDAAASGFLYTFVENQGVVASRLIPLGQSAAQRVLSRALDRIPEAIKRGFRIDDDSLGQCAPGHGIACMGHETQYSRLFLS